MPSRADERSLRPDATALSTTLAVLALLVCGSGCGGGTFEWLEPGSTSESTDADDSDAGDPGAGDSGAVDAGIDDSGVDDSGTVDPGVDDSGTGDAVASGTDDVASDAADPDIDSSDPGDLSPDASQSSAPPTIDDVVAALTKDRMQEIVYELTSDAYAGRDTGAEGETKARKYIAGHLAAAGTLPGFDDGYEQFFTVRQKTTANVVGYLPARDDSPTRDEIVVVGGHHDHLGPGYPGADDNASGTAMVIEMAYALAQLQTELMRTAVFVTFSGEERGCLGSSYYAGNDSQFPLRDTVLYVNLDMVGMGRNKSASGATALEKPFDPSLMFYESMLATSCTWDADTFRREGVETNNSWYTGSHRCYHASCDTADRLNYDGMAIRAQDVLQTLWSALQGAVSDVP